MKISTKRLREELSRGREEFEDDLTPRVVAMLEIIEKEILKEKEIHLFDLVVHVILRGDREPNRQIIKLMQGFTPDSYEYLDGWAIQKAAFFLGDCEDRTKVKDALLEKRKKSMKLEF